MKKLALLAAILLLFGLTAGFAETTVDVSGSAEVTIAGRLLPVARRDEVNRDHTCPIEMITASLGA